MAYAFGLSPPMAAVLGKAGASRTIFFLGFVMVCLDMFELTSGNSVGKRDVFVRSDVTKSL